ncbi:diguanylate cyclase domain-containing protein [Kitasatospora sp. NPDC057542]|uniref:diguanylate cyclase domain-containing protein n=1 Tax=Kitasatospora sp. NPDC057542 TaxID=3346162 RepID=UPI0036A921CE
MTARSHQATPTAAATGGRAAPAGSPQAAPGDGGKTLTVAAARAMVLARIPAAVRIEALRETVRRLLEANRRLRQRLVASDDQIRELTQERKQLHAELAEARTDPVSGLAGRQAFTRHAAELLRTTKRGYSVVLLDLDEFKPVNDRFGHAAGDAVLAAVGDRIAHWLGPEESAARLGGDEFVILATHDARLPGRVNVLRDAITAPVSHGGLTLKVGVSAGSARVTGGLSRALGAADQAMYEAKGSGRRGRTAAAPRDV